NVSFPAVYSEAIDDAAVRMGYREETSYLGVLRFFTATAIFWWSVIFLIVSTITGYDPSIEYTQANPPTLIQRIGLNMQVSVIPAVLVLISILIFSKYNKITKEVAMANKKKLIEMGL
ncbi:MAG: MFS transporter, partial [Promethearchaeota archaeon]